MKKLLLLFLLTTAAQAQELLFHQWQAAKLPSRECYNITQDRKGYIWFATEQGFCRFDGKHITVYDRKNGLAEAAVYSVQEDKKGRLWLLTNKGRILIMENGKLREAPFSKTYEDQYKGFDTPFSLKLLNDKELYINSDTGTCRADIQNNSLQEIIFQNSLFFNALRMGNALLPVKTTANQPNVGSLYVKLKIHGGNRPDVFVDIHSPNPIMNNFRFMQTHKIRGGNLCSVNNTLIKLDKKDQYKTYILPQRILTMYEDTDGGIWIGLLNQGVYYYPDGNLDRKPIISLSGYSVSGILKDSEGNTWCTTLEKGIFFCRNKDVIYYGRVKSLDKPATLLKAMGDTVFVSGEMGILTVFGRDGIMQESFKGLFRERINDVVRHKGKTYISGNEYFMETDARFKTFKPVISYDSRSNTGGGRIILEDGHMYVSQRSVLGKVVNNVFGKLIGFPFNNRYNEPLGNGFWLVGSDRLYLADLSTAKLTLIPGIFDAITKIIPVTGGDHLISTKGGGLYRYRSGKIFPLNRKLEIPSGVLFDLAEDAAGDIWIASNVGLIRLKKQQDTFKAELFTTLHGLPSDEIYKVAVTAKTVFLSTDEGVCSFPLGAGLLNAHVPRIYFNSLHINGKKNRTEALGEVLAHDQNSLHFTFDVLSFKDAPRLYYVLDGTASEARTVDGNEISLNLPTGKYGLKVFGVNSDGIKSALPLSYHFEIASPFWMQGWFLALCFLLLAVLIYLIVKQITRSIRKKEQEQTRINKLIADSRMQALQAQMNPHFIFNAINSIQNYILKNNGEAAYDYLVKFSRLIRIVLQNSRQKLLALHDELETIQLYVELEQLRFQDSFEFEQRIDRSVDEYEVMIPAMLIQPFLENAIWHGLMPLGKDRKGKITLDISARENLLHIVVEDNGVGRDRARQYVRENPHQPIAMQLTEERLSIVNALYDNEKVQVEIVDLFNNDATPAGTRISISLPLDYDG